MSENWVIMATEERAEQEATISGGEDIVGNDEDGVLLYYKFVQLPEPEKIKSWLFDMSASLGLLGRIRVAPDGINVTVGGKIRALREHMKVVGSDPLFEGSDFKLAPIVSPVNHEAAAECGFTSLSARMVKELVTLGLHPSVEQPSASKAGKHVSAQEFHDILLNVAMASETDSWRNSALGAGTGVSIGGGVNSKLSLWTVTANAPCDDGTESGDKYPMTKPSEWPRDIVFPKKVVVLDARNLYETRIGKICPPQGVELLDPMVRQYSDLPSWIDKHEDCLRNSQILMYCTGGVRCEMASAYIRSKGKEFEDVLQLSGGIQRYLEAFPDGGYFIGKNFVFDHRLAVPSLNREVVGSCIICSAPFDDYSGRSRCSLCRMLVLVCAGCQVADIHASGGPDYVCELCTKERKPSKPTRQAGTDEVYERRLKILCLHGFRQNASSLKGRLNALRKKLRQKVEFVFVDAPHEIPSISLNCELETTVVEESLKDAQSNDKDPPPQASGSVERSRTATRKVSKKFAWLINQVTVADAAATEMPESWTDRSKSAMGCDGPEAPCPKTADTERLESIMDRPDFVIRCDDPKAQLCTVTTAPVSHQCVLEHSVPSLGHALGNAVGSESGTSTANSLQYQTQTEGWSRSWEHLKNVFAELGPFDGVLGFSQGAAVAAALCTMRSIPNQHAEAVNFRFTILCSGFCSPAVEHQQSMSPSDTATAIDCPSLHVFGGSPGVDRQIGVSDSEKLASLFRSDHRMMVRHKFGHIVPTQPEYVQQYLKFLSQF